MNKNVQILSIEGKDLLTKNYRVDKNTLRKGSLDDSMEVDELREIGKYIIKFNNKKKRFYTNDIINVTFEYACKGEKDLTDEEFERLESLKLTLDLVKENKIKKDIKEQILLAERKIDKREIREQLYVHGFNINIDGKTKHFVRYKRTGGSARVGKCLFISDRLAKKMIDWSFAGIPHEEGIEMDCAGMEAYISLPTSSAIDRMQLKPENILLIDDCYSEFEDTVMATKLINQEIDNSGNVIGGDLCTDIETTKIKNNIFDGESLLDKSVFDEKGYGDKAILQIRNRFFKGIGVNTDIQQFFKDNNINSIEQLNGKTIATDISQIKLITTPSSVKYLKFGSFKEWLKYIVPNWAICKYEKPQHHFNGMAQTHYQLLNTLGMSKDDMELFLKDTIDYINLLKNDISVFKYHLGINSKAENIGDIEEKDELSSNIDSTNSFILNMLEINEDFEFTKMCKKYRKNCIDSYIRNARKGHILVEGNYSTMVSCPYEFLLASIGRFNGESQLKPFECVSMKFDNGEDILSVRSPEPTMSNITVFKNTRNEYIEKYFNTKSKEVIYISPINNNIMELLSSCDFDGDAVLITNNKYLVENAKSLQETIIINEKEIKRFLVSTDFTPKSTIKRKYTPLDLADIDIKCSSNKIGEIINLAQMLNSLYWDKKYKGCSEEELLELYKDISNLNILSCIEIDRAKKLSPVDAKKELDKIRKKHSLGKGEIIRNKEKKEVGIRPMFFKYLDGGKDYKFKRFETGMDYLNKVIDKRIDKWSKGYDKEIKIHKLLCGHTNKKTSRKTIEKIKKYYIDMRNNINYLYATNHPKKYEEIQYIKNYTIDKVNKTNIDTNVVYNIIKRIGMSDYNSKYEDYKKLGFKIISMLYECDKVSVLNCFKIKTKDNLFLIKDNKGDINIYGVLFKKTLKRGTHDFNE